jgi:Amt family ammonium transporter
VASAATFAYSFVVSLLIAKVIDLLIGLRVSPEQELEGLDRSQHAETAYAFGSIASGLGTIVSHGSEADQRSTADV